MPKTPQSPQEDQVTDGSGRITTGQLHFDTGTGAIDHITVFRDTGATYNSWEIHSAGSSENPYHFTLASGQDTRTWTAAEIETMTGWTALDDVGSHSFTIVIS